MRFVIFFLLLSSVVYSDWAHETLSKMSLDEKIGQLFVVPIGCRIDKETREIALKSIQENHVGGVILKQGDPESQIALVRQLQATSLIPLITVQDAEWGLTMQLENSLRFPKNMTLGAIQDDALLYQFGKEIGRELKLVGVNIALCPVVDVNTNPLNPIIGDRSFGDNPEDVAKKGCLIAAGLKDSGVCACAKHFPGHGDTSVDSHLSLPVLEHSKERLEVVDFVPFKALIDQGIESIMLAHMYVPALDARVNMPSSLSDKVVQDVLKKELNFSGLVITDALNMKGILGNYSAAEASLMAFKAGSDLLLFGDHISNVIKEIHEVYVPAGIAAIREAIISKEIPEKTLDERVLRVLKAKEKIHFEILDEELFPESAKQLKKRLYAEAVTVLGPFNFNSDATIIQIGGKPSKLLQDAFSDYSYVQEGLMCQEMQDFIKKKENVVIALLGINRLRDKRYGISQNTIDFVQSMNGKGTLVIFGSPYSLSYLSHPSTIVAYEDDPDAIEAVIDILKGKTQATGKLPVSLR